MNRMMLLPLAAALTVMTGCYQQPVYGPPLPPPPPVYAGPPPALVQLADRNGYRAGADDGARDAYYHAGYAPQGDRKYRDAPGYDYRLGPIPPYVEEFRRAYLRAYQEAFYRTNPNVR